MEENKNTFPYKTNIIINRRVLTPTVGDELIFCANEDVALTSFSKFVDDERDPEYEPIEELLYTDIFCGKAIKGELLDPVYIGGKRFGFFGCRTRLTDKITNGHFFLYEMN